jgi:hypothetical protein
MARAVEELGLAEAVAGLKRLGFMLEARHGDQFALIEACRSRLTSGYVKLDPRLPVDRLITAWRLWVPAATARGAAR